MWSLLSYDWGHRAPGRHSPQPHFMNLHSCLSSPADGTPDVVTSVCASQPVPTPHSPSVTYMESCAAALVGRDPGTLDVLHVDHAAPGIFLGRLATKRGDHNVVEVAHLFFVSISNKRKGENRLYVCAVKAGCSFFYDDAPLEAESSILQNQRSGSPSSRPTSFFFLFSR